MLTITKQYKKVIRSSEKERQRISEKERDKDRGSDNERDRGRDSGSVRERGSDEGRGRGRGRVSGRDEVEAYQCCDTYEYGRSVSAFKPFKFIDPGVGCTE